MEENMKTNENVKVPVAEKTTRKTEAEYEKEIVGLKAQLRAVNRQLDEAKIYKNLFKKATVKLDTITKLTELINASIDEFAGDVNECAQTIYKEENVDATKSR